MYSGVLGGCNIGNVIDFPSMFASVCAKVDENSFPTHPSKFFKAARKDGVYFYTHYLNWFEMLNAGIPDYKVK